MNQRPWAVLTAFVCGACVAIGAAAEPRAKASPGDEVFGLTKVGDFHLDVPAAEWDKMQPTGGGSGFGPPPGFGPPGAGSEVPTREEKKP
jgi:hypothetical protein